VGFDKVAHLQTAGIESIQLYRLDPNLCAANPISVVAGCLIAIDDSCDFLDLDLRALLHPHRLEYRPAVIGGPPDVFDLHSGRCHRAVGGEEGAFVAIIPGLGLSVKKLLDGGLGH
jgi:hypothetical protein